MSRAGSAEEGTVALFANCQVNDAMRLAPVMRPKFMRPKLVRYATLLSSVSVLLGVAVLSIQQGLTQSAPTCDPPGTNEYLLLVINQQAGTEEQLRQILPENAVIISCQYLDDSVVRVGGFTSTEIAEAWAKYVTDTTGRQAFVVGSTADTATATPPAPAPTVPNETLAFPAPTQTPSAEAASSPTPTGSPSLQDATSELPSLNQTPDASTPDASATPSTPPSSPSATTIPSPNSSTSGTGSSTNPVFAPKPLGSGYAVLVNYANRPEVAADVQQVTSQPVGLVAYNQRPFLLATYTTDPAAATAVLQSLNDRGFNAILIDSRSAVLLTPAVVGAGG